MIYQRGNPPPGADPHKVGSVLNQTDFTATRVPGGPEAGRALAFRWPSVTALVRTSDSSARDTDGDDFRTAGIWMDGDDDFSLSNPMDDIAPI